MTSSSTKPLFVTALLASVVGTAVLGCSSEDPATPQPQAGSGGQGQPTAGTGQGGSVSGGGQGGSVAGMGQGGSVAGMGQGGSVAGMAGSGTGGASGGSGGGSSSVGLPASDSKEDIVAFLKAGTYKTSPWVKAQEAQGKNHTNAPMDVWLSPPLVTSIRANRVYATGATAADVGSMAVKEFLNDGGTVVGHAVIYRGKPADAATSWTYFCYGPAGRCPPGTSELALEAAVYTQNDNFQCSACHSTLAGGVAPMFFSKAP